MGLRISNDNTKWKLNTILFEGYTVMLAESENDLLKLVISGFVKKEGEVIINFGDPYNVRNEYPQQSMTWFNGHLMEEMNNFKYLGFIMCKHRNIKGERREKAWQGMKHMMVDFQV